jgi:hypothetical protein
LLPIPKSWHPHRGANFKFGHNNTRLFQSLSRSLWLIALLNNATGVVVTKDGAAFVDLDAIPKESLGFEDGIQLLLSDKAISLHSLLKG